MHVCDSKYKSSLVDLKKEFAMHIQSSYLPDGRGIESTGWISVDPERATTVLLKTVRAKPFCISAAP